MAYERRMSPLAEALAKIDISVGDEHCRFEPGSSMSCTSVVKRALYLSSESAEMGRRSSETRSTSPPIDFAVSESKNPLVSVDTPTGCKLNRAVDRSITTDAPAITGSGISDAPTPYTSNTWSEAIQAQEFLVGLTNSHVEHGTTGAFACYPGEPSNNVDFLDPFSYASFCSTGLVVHDPLFDDPSVRAKFTEDTPSQRWFWHKETGNIVEGMPEIRPEVANVLARAEAVGLFGVNYG